jgi:hypothetical protein
MKIMSQKMAENFIICYARKLPSLFRGEKNRISKSLIRLTLSFLNTSINPII